jgi:hypothetical protein
MDDTWDEEENNESSLMLDWATSERIATNTARETAKEHIFNRERILSKAKHQLNVRG